MTQVDGMLALLPQRMLDEIGAEVGDEFDVTLENDTLVVRPREVLGQVVSPMHLQLIGCQ